MNTATQTIQGAVRRKPDDWWGPDTELGIAQERAASQARVADRRARGMMPWLNADGSEVPVGNAPMPPHPDETRHYLLGMLDINHNNFGDGVPWDLLQKQGFFLFCHKVSEDTDFLDPLWPSRRKQAEERGLKVMGYHFCGPGAVAKQADRFLLHGNFDPAKHAFAIDWEEQRRGNMQLHAVEEFACILHAKLGREAVIYFGRGLGFEQLQSRLEAGGITRLSSCPLWSVDLLSTPMPTSYPKAFWPSGPVIHQYAGDGLGVNFLPKTIPGCEKGMDLDRVFFDTRDAFEKAWPL